MSSSVFDISQALHKLESTECVFNPWNSLAPDDVGDAHLAVSGRRLRLSAHLSRGNPKIILCGEAPGWRGARISGMAFTSERLLLDGRIPGMYIGQRLSTARLPLSEPSATVVWGTLHELGLTKQAILWNAFPLHPFVPGNPYSNRAPSRAELDLGLPILQAVLDLAPHALVVAIGNHAQRAISRLDLRRPTIAVRHPSFGGATAFRKALTAAAAGAGIAEPLKTSLFDPRR